MKCAGEEQTVASGRHQHLNLFDWITSPDWLDSYKTFLDSISTELVRQGSVELDAAKDAVKEGLWDYLSKAMHRRWNSKFPEKPWAMRSRIKGVAKGLPILRSGWHQARSFLPGRENELSLQALLRKSSRYHSDFMPIYKSVTRSAKNDRPVG